jgi:hypothetical protein
VYGAADDAYLHDFDRIMEAFGVSVSTAQGSAAADVDYVDKCETLERMRMYDWACASKPRRPATDDDDDDVEMLFLWIRMPVSPALPARHAHFR